MLARDEIELSNFLYDFEFVMDVLKKHQKNDDDEYAAAYSIVYEQFRILKDYYTYSPRIYRGKQKTLQLISDTLEGGDVGYFTDGELFHKITDKPLRMLNEWIQNDSYIFIRFFEGRANYQYEPDQHS